MIAKMKFVSLSGPKADIDRMIEILEPVIAGLSS